MAEGKPQPTLRWYKDDYRVLMTDRRMKFLDSGTLQITGKSYNYDCWNSAGSSLSYCLIINCNHAHFDLPHIFHYGKLFELFSAAYNQRQSCKVKRDL